MRKSKILTFVIAAVIVIGGALFVSDNFNLTKFLHGYGLHAEAGSLPLSYIEDYNSKELEGDAKVDSKSMKIDPEFVDPESHCEFCTRVEYIPAAQYIAGAQGVAGVAYKIQQAIDLTDAKRVTFWVMGQEGGEELRFFAAGKNIDKVADKSNGTVTKNTAKGVFKNQVFSVMTNKVKLDKNWQKYEIDLRKGDLKQITHLFGFEISKGLNQEKKVFYLKGVTIDTEVAQNPLSVVNDD